MIEKDLIWQRFEGHRRLTIRVVQAFPEDKLLTFSAIEPMRTFAQMVGELLQLESVMMPGTITGTWKPWNEASHDAKLRSKTEILAALDEVRQSSSALWPHMTSERLNTVEPDLWGGPPSSMRSRLEYMLDNEIHHRGQGYVYLRLLGIEPPGFWER